MSGYRKYHVPAFLEGRTDQPKYNKWLSSQSTRHYLRDKKCRDISATAAQYKREIHEAVLRSGGRDEYTGRDLDWENILTYDNDDSVREGYKYRRKFLNLPTVDHEWVNDQSATFHICSWRTNDAKSDLSYEELLQFCEQILNYREAQDV